MNATTIQKKSSMYPLVGSLGLHVLFTLGAGGFLLNLNKSIIEQKTYKLEFVKRKAPPPVKKEKIRKEIVRQEIKVASIQPKPMPVVQPKTVIRQTMVQQTTMAQPTISNVAPRQVQTHRAPILQTATRHSSSSNMSKRVTRNIPVARSFTSVNNTPTGKSTTRMAMIQGNRHFKTHNLPKLIPRSYTGKSSSKATTKMAMVQGSSSFTPRNLPKPIARSSGRSSTSRGTKRVSPVQTGMKLASLSSLPSPRGVPNIVDRGALRGYISQIQRIIEAAKKYPEASRRAGRQGKLKVQFTIFRSGEVDNIKLLTQTPYANLNREAMDAIRRAAPFSGFPASLTEQSVQVILPFRFELN